MIYDTLISTADLARHLGDPAFVIVDCRHNLADVDAGERAYRAAHIPGAVFLHLDRDLSGAKTGRNASAAEILRHLNDRSLSGLDARAPERFRGDLEPLDPVAGHIPGAYNRPYGENLTPKASFKPAELLRSEFEALLGDTPPSAVVHHCGSGVTACHNVLAMSVAALPGSRLYPGSWSEWIADPERPVARGDEAR